MDENIKKIFQNQLQTFVITIKSCENQTWQGTVKWVETKKTQPFRSALELLRLMDSTLPSSEESEEHEEHEK